MKPVLYKLYGLFFWLRYRLFNDRIHVGYGLVIKSRLKIIGPGQVHFGNNCTIDGIPGDSCKYVTIDTYSPGALIRIGDNVSLFAARLSSKYGIAIGNNCLIEDTTLIDTDFHSIDKDRGEPIGESFERCRIIIGNNVCIGTGCLITKGSVIGDGSIVIPGSVVTTAIKSNVVVSGNPARPVLNQKTE